VVEMGRKNGDLRCWVIVYAPVCHHRDENGG
jgi:hypothetical protein